MNANRLNSFTDGVIAIIATLIAYLSAIPLAFLWPWFSVAIYVGVALVWLVPDRRFEQLIS